MKNETQLEKDRAIRLEKTSWFHILSIAWPIFLANITIPLVGAVDTAMMGRIPNLAYIGGVSLGTLVFSFIYQGFGFLRMCTTGLVAQAHGRNDEAEIENLLIRGLVIAFILGAIAILATPVIHKVTSNLFAASNSVEVHMQTYVGIRLFAAPAAFGNMVLLGCLLGRQQMRLCMAQIIVVNISNLILNILFVFGFGMRIEGIAFASVASQWLGFTLTLGLIGWQWREMLRGSIARFFMRNPAWLDLHALGQFFSLSLDLILRTLMLLTCEAIFLNNAAGFGDIELAVAQLVIVMFGMISFGLDGYAHVTEALVGEAIGCKDSSMLVLVIKRTNALAFASALLIGLVIFAGEIQIIRALTNQKQLIETTALHWNWVAVMPVAAFLAFQMDGVFVGATRSRDMRNAMLISMAVFIALILLAAPYGFSGLLAAFTIWLVMRGLTLLLLLPKVIRLAI